MRRGRSLNSEPLEPFSEPELFFHRRHRENQRMTNKNADMAQLRQKLADMVANARLAAEREAM